MVDRLLILSVFIVASCGLAYELIAGALASYLLGDSILQFSSIIGAYLFAMGIGAHLAKYVKDKDVLACFIDVELLVALVGGVSAAVLFAVFAWATAPFRTLLYAFVLVIGMLVGMEIPLVMRTLNARHGEFREIVSRVLTFDYLGALVVSLLFPLLLAPALGLARTALLFGILNAAVAVAAAYAFRTEIANAHMRGIRGAVVLGLLVAGFAGAETFTHWNEKRLYGDDIVHAETTPYQRLVVTRWHDDLRLYINGNLQFSSRDEHRYHEALVQPVLEAATAAKSVLILGGGDGLALREVLKRKHIERIVLVDLDPAMTRLFSSAAPLVALNQGSLSDRRVTVVNEDAARWLETHDDVFDIIIADFPDPSNFSLGKLYTVPVYRLFAKHLAERGYIAIQAASPYYAPRAYWCINATIIAAGLHTWPYHAYVPSFGEWGFIVAARRADFRPPSAYTVPLRFLDGETTRLMFGFPADMQPVATEINHLNSQVLVRYFEEDWGMAQR
jgi:spermidine synthase